MAKTVNELDARNVSLLVRGELRRAKAVGIFYPIQLYGDSV